MQEQLPASGIKLIREFEGCKLHAYPDPCTGNKPITIGWGSTRKLNGNSWHLGESITQEAADELLITQLQKNYLPALQKIPNWNQLTQNQKGAILSFAYNLGANWHGSSGFASITKLLNEKNLWDNDKEVIRIFGLYCNPGTSVEAGLRRRRLKEAQLWLTLSPAL